MKSAARRAATVHAPRVIEVTRGGLVESSHLVRAAVSDGGRLLELFGDAARPTFYRSCSKPMQAYWLLESGAADRFGLTTREIALACGSHSGTGAHTSTVKLMLERGGLTERDLQCGVHPPRDESTLEAMRISGEPPNALHHNCSGKHAGMLLACQHAGWPVENYLDPAHPHQIRLRAAIAAYAGMPPEQVGVAIDGCSAPVFAVPVSGMAQSFARLAQGLGPGGEPSGSVGRIRDAMRTHPDMVGGPGRLDTEFMWAAGGDYIVKIGAEGVYGVGHLPTGFGLALKVEDGNTRAVSVALFDLLETLGWPVPAGLDAFAFPMVTNFRDIEVGVIRPVRGTLH